jgi:hypothetical protein
VNRDNQMDLYKQLGWLNLWQPSFCNNLHMRLVAGGLIHQTVCTVGYLIANPLWPVITLKLLQPSICKRRIKFISLFLSHKKEALCEGILSGPVRFVNLLSSLKFNPSIVKISSRKILRPPVLVPRGRCRSDSPYPSSPSPLLSPPYSPPSAEAAGQSPCGAVGGGGALRPATCLAAELLPRVNGGASVLLFGGGVLLRAGIWCLAQPRFRPFWAHMGLGGQAASSYCGAS